MPAEPHKSLAMAREQRGRFAKDEENFEDVNWYIWCDDFSDLLHNEKSHMFGRLNVTTVLYSIINTCEFAALGVPPVRVHKPGFTFVQHLRGF